MPRYRARDIFTKFNLAHQGLSHAWWYWKLVANVYLVTGQSDRFFLLRHILSEEDPTMGHVLQFRSFQPTTMPWIIQDRHDFGFFHTVWLDQQMWWTNSYLLLQSNRFIKTVSAKIASDFDELDLLRSDTLDNFALFWTPLSSALEAVTLIFSATSHMSSHKNRFAFFTSWDLLPHKISEYRLHWQEPLAPWPLRTEQKLLK